MITFLRFARAHTVVGTTLSLLALFLMAGRDVERWDWSMFALSLIACLSANVYITGLNQLTDIEIDRINKPYLPLASGAYSVRTGQLIVGVCGVLAVILSLMDGLYLAATVLISLAIGTAYSLPPLRLKRFHFWAAFCIIVVRGLVVNLLLYLHYHMALGGEAVFSTSVLLLTSIIFVFGAIIAWFKDLPDTEGDAAYGIRTLALVRNRKWVYSVGAGLLKATFLLVAIIAFFSLGNRPLAVAHVLQLLTFQALGARLDLDDQASIATFYQRVWVLFFLEYLIFAVLG